jgi:hypothetical protein
MLARAESKKKLDKKTGKNMIVILDLKHMIILEEVKIMDI